MIKPKHEVVFLWDTDSVNFSFIVFFIGAHISIIFTTFLALNWSFHWLYHVLPDAMLTWAPIRVFYWVQERQSLCRYLTFRVFFNIICIEKEIYVLLSSIFWWLCLLEWTRFGFGHYGYCTQPSLLRCWIIGWFLSFNPRLGEPSEVISRSLMVFLLGNLWNHSLLILIIIRLRWSIIVSFGFCERLMLTNLWWFIHRCHRDEIVGVTLATLL